MLALVDYLRNERPDQASDHVFLHHRAPHHSLEHSVNPFHYVTTNAHDRASVKALGYVKFLGQFVRGFLFV